MMLINGCVPRDRAYRLWQQAHRHSGAQGSAIVAPAVGGMQPQGKPAVLPFYPELALS